MRDNTVTVLSGQTASNWCNTGSHVCERGVVGIVTPAALTSTTLTIQVSLDGSNALAHYDFTGNAYSIPIGTSRWISLDPALFAGFPYIRLVTGSAEGADRTFTLMMTEVA